MIKKSVRNNRSLKIVALACSPNRNGNSDTLLDAFISGIEEENKDILVEKFYVHEIPASFYDYKHSKKINEEEEPELATVCNKIEKAF